MIQMGRDKKNKVIPPHYIVQTGQSHTTTEFYWF